MYFLMKTQREHGELVPQNIRRMTQCKNRSVISESLRNHQQENNKCDIYYDITVCKNKPVDILQHFTIYY